MSTTYTSKLNLFLNSFCPSSLEFFCISGLSLEWQWLLRRKIAAVLTSLVIFDAYFLFFLLHVMLLMPLTIVSLHGFTLPDKLCPSLGHRCAWLDVWCRKLPIYGECILIWWVSHNIPFTRRFLACRNLFNACWFPNPTKLFQLYVRRLSSNHSRTFCVEISVWVRCGKVFWWIIWNL